MLIRATYRVTHMFRADAKSVVTLGVRLHLLQSEKERSTSADVPVRIHDSCKSTRVSKLMDRCLSPECWSCVCRLISCKKNANFVGHRCSSCELEICGHSYCAIRVNAFDTPKKPKMAGIRTSHAKKKQYGKNTDPALEWRIVRNPYCARKGKQYSQHISLRRIKLVYTWPLKLNMPMQITYCTSKIRIITKMIKMHAQGWEISVDLQRSQQWADTISKSNFASNYCRLFFFCDLCTLMLLRLIGAEHEREKDCSP